MDAGKLLAPLALACAQLSATWAIASSPTDSVADPEAARLVAEFADCVTAQKSRKPAVDAFLRTVPNQRAFDVAALKAADLACLNTAAARTHSKIEMRLQPVSFRDALFPSLYRRTFGHRGPSAGLQALPPLRLSEEFDGDVAALPADFVAGRLFGDCVARENAADAHALLTAKPATPAETAAIDRLKPAFAACIKQAQTISLTPGAIRATVGEAMYKLSSAAGAAR